MAETRKKNKFNLAHPLIGFLTGGLVWISFSFGLFSGLENFFEDNFFSQKPIDKQIVIIAIDDDSIKRIGQWPWPRETFAKFLLKLNKNPPLSLGVDVMFSEPSRSNLTDDEALSTAIKNAVYPIIFPVEAQPLFLEKNKTPIGIKFLKPLMSFQSQEQASLGSTNLISDFDSVVRQFPLLVSEKENNKKYLSFAYETVKRSGLNIPNESNLKTVNRIVYSAQAGFIRRVPFWRIMEEDAAAEIKDKIVFIGATAADLHDESPTPFGKGQKMPGIEIHANIANMLLSGYRLNPLEGKMAFFWILLAALIPSFIFNLARSNIVLFLANVSIGAGYLVASIVLFQNGVATNIIHINFSWILSTAFLFGHKFFIIEKEKREMKSLFSKYVSREVLEEILKNPSQVTLGGEEKEITVLFSDIRGFTSISEKTTPQELVRLLNKYFTAMTEQILKNDGVLDKYIGDAIMAFWGAPIENSQQADKAVIAAIQMIQKLDELNNELKSESIPEIKIGVGIYTGSAVVGNIGSNLRFDYTAIGDTVNTASRLEGLCKEYNTRIIIGKTTKNKLKDDYNLKFLGSVLVKGKNKSIDIYTPTLQDQFS